MDEKLLQNFLDQQKNWMPDISADSGEGGDDGSNVGKQGPVEKAETGVPISSRGPDVSCGGNEFSRLELSGNSIPWLESSSRAVGNPDGWDEPKADCDHSSNQSNKKLMRVIQEMKQCLPAETVKSCGKGSILGALHYALKCVQQIQNCKDFQLFGERGAYSPSARAYHVDDLASVTREHTSQNSDSFVAVFSLVSGLMVHISEQAASILNCKKECLDSSCFTELLVPQDVGIFYIHTNQLHLPLWSVETQAASLSERAQVKSFFCRLKGGKGRSQEKCCYPFRMIPYLVNVCACKGLEAEACCLLLAEKIHSGYEAPRIPLEKRIFTTTHTPSCVFLEVDDRAVPLLGYLPQDLIGTCLLKYLHPDDRSLMAAVHHRVLAFAGQPPFEHSPIRFCTQNGDYVVLDTSWSSFVNPWSRKVAFIIGRHRVRTSPLTEDIFAINDQKMNRAEKDISELQGQIYKLLLQPVHSSGSSGYGSHISNGSYEHCFSLASSSDSTRNLRETPQRDPKSFQPDFVGVSRRKNMDQQQQQHVEMGKAHTASNVLPAVSNTTSSGDPPLTSCGDSSSASPGLSYQQINCMDSIIRFLESCSVPPLKRKCDSSADSTSSSSEEGEGDQLMQDDVLTSEDTAGSAFITSQPVMESKVPLTIGMDTPAAELALTSKALRVTPMTSPCSYSRTHVDFPHQESEAMVLGESILPLGPPESATTVAEEIGLVGLMMKEALSAHAPKEEQNYMGQIHQRILSPFRSSLPSQGAQGGVHSNPLSPQSWTREGKQDQSRNRKLLVSSDDGSGQKDGRRDRRAAAQKPSWARSEEPPSDPWRMALPVHPCSGFGFPLGPGGQSPVLHPVAVAPILWSDFPIPTFHPPSSGSLTALLCHGFPVPAFFPQAPSCTTQPPWPSPPCTRMSPPPTPAPPSMLANPAERVSLEDQQRVISGGLSPLLSSSGSSCPLQLNLLREEPPEACIEIQPDEEDDGCTGSYPVSSKLADILLLEDSDAPSGAGSGSPGSGSESSSFASGLGPGSRNSSGCLANVDSSENSKGGKTNHEEGEERLPSRVKEEVLKEDLEKLVALERMQPYFTPWQKKELAEAHPWIGAQTVPQEINTQGCLMCDSSCKTSVPVSRDPPRDNHEALLLCDPLPAEAPI